MPRQYISRSSFKTKKLGENLAKKFLNSPPPAKKARLASRRQEGAWLVGLEGDLGSGKTTFLQGLARGLGIKEKITSPTFVLMKRFQFNNLTIKQFNNFYHIDCYRIKEPKEILDLGFKKIISEPNNIVAIEWVGHIRQILPKDAIILKFEFIDAKTRKIRILNQGLL